MPMLRATEIIAKLQALVEQFGDLPCVVDGPKPAFADVIFAVCLDKQVAQPRVFLFTGDDALKSAARGP